MSASGINGNRVEAIPEHHSRTQLAQVRGWVTPRMSGTEHNSVKLPGRLVKLLTVAQFFPISERSIYQARRRGNAPWLHHTNPNGHPCRQLWVEPDELMRYFDGIGKKLPDRLVQELNARAVQVRCVDEEGHQA